MRRKSFGNVEVKELDIEGKAQEKVGNSKGKVQERTRKVEATQDGARNFTDAWTAFWG